MIRARILVVDDDPEVLRLVARVLESAGHEITTARRPSQALEIITISGAFDLLVSDVAMPEMCGPDLAEQVRLLSPSSAVMLMSGSFVVGQLPQGIPFVSKPFLPSDLLRSVESALRKSSVKL